MPEETGITPVPLPIVEPKESEPYPIEESIPPPPDPNRLAAMEQAGPDAELVECPTCGAPRAKFVIIDGKCDSCRTRDQAAAIVPILGWPEVRQRRDILIQETDWTQLPDVDQAVMDKYLPLRQSLRDITDEPTPLKGWYKLDELQPQLRK